MRVAKRRGWQERVGLHARLAWGPFAEHAAPGGVAAVMFNLGYFPGGDHAVITRTADTLLAASAAARGGAEAGRRS
jgi:hypothetical protein